MEAILTAIAASDIATAVRLSRWLYAAVNTAHVLGIALLVGSIFPLDLRLMGAWGGVARDGLVRVLLPVAAAGLVLAMCTGALLFATRAAEYAAIPLFLVKQALIATGAGSALALHFMHGFRLAGAGRGRLAWASALSMTCWLGALIAGRLLAFVSE
jgi:hypothetical protein